MNTALIENTDKAITSLEKHGFTKKQARLAVKVVEKEVGLSEGLVPNAATGKRLLKSKRDIEAGKNLVGPFATVKEMMASLDA